MNQDENNFLRELQEACLKEMEDYLNEFREILSDFKNDHLKSIELIQKVIHSMKGNLQAVAFLDFGNYVHELETILDKKAKSLVASDKAVPEFEMLICEYLVSSILEAMISYHDELRRVGVDSPEFAKARAEQLSALDKWVPKFESADEPMFTPPEKISYEQPDIDALVLGTVENKPILNLVPPDLNIEDPAVEAPTESIPFVDSPVLPEVSVQAVPEVKQSPEVKSSDAKSPTDKPPKEWENYSGSGLFLLFQNQMKYFAIAIEHIVEVIKSQPLSSPPHKRKNLSGLLNLRGEVLPILNVEEILSEGQRNPTYVVVSQVDDLRFGFLVEAVHQVVTLNPKSFQAVDGISASQGGVVTHFCQTEDKTISILKLNELVAV
ncbi:MAG: chemotaxis protein CheW [Bdellovibrionota bacterium]